MSNFTPNPYQSPENDYGTHAPRRDVSGKVQPPAIGLVVCGGISAAHAVYAFIRNVTGMNDNDEGPPPNVQDNPALMELYETLQPYDGVINITASVVALGVSLIILYGGLQMFKQRSYAVSLTAAILAICPCIWICGCCGIGNGIGIWALVVLMSSDVKQAFV